MKVNILEHGKIYHNPDSFFKYCGWPSVCKDKIFFATKIIKGDK